MINKDSRNFLRKRRHDRIRKRVKGTAEYPRLSIYRSLRHIYAQVIDDEAGNTLVWANSLEKGFECSSNMTEKAKKLGEVLAGRMKEKNIESIVFDRSGYKYHGRIAAFADTLRESGIQF